MEVCFLFTALSLNALYPHTKFHMHITCDEEVMDWTEIVKETQTPTNG